MGMAFLSCLLLVMGETFLLWWYYYMGITFHLCFHRNHLPIMVPFYAFLLYHLCLLSPTMAHHLMLIYPFIFLLHYDITSFILLCSWLIVPHASLAPHIVIWLTPILIKVILLLCHRFIHPFLAWLTSLLCCPSCRTWSVHTFTSFHVLPLKYFHGLCAHCMYV